MQAPRPLLHLECLPAEILNEIYILCAIDVIAVLEQPPRTQLSVKPNAHTQRFSFRYRDNHAPLTLPLLRVNKAIRHSFIHVIASHIPLQLSIPSYAPSIFPPTHLLLPPSWPARVRHIRVPRFIGSLASLPSLLAPFTGLRTVVVKYPYIRAVRFRSPWAHTSFRTRDALRDVLWWQTLERDFVECLDREVCRSLDKVVQAFEDDTCLEKRAFELAVTVRFGQFTVEADRVPARRAKRYHAITGSVYEADMVDGVAKVVLKRTEEFDEVLVGEKNVRLFYWA